MTRLASNPSLPTSQSNGKSHNTFRTLPKESGPFCEDTVQQATNAFHHLSRLRPPNMSHRSTHLNEKTDALWLVTLREVAFHFSKIGEAINQCASETEKLLQSHEGGEACREGGKSSPHLNHHLHREDVNRPQQTTGQYPNGGRPLHSQNDHYSYSVVVNDSGNSNSKSTPRCVRPPPLYPNPCDVQQMQSANAPFPMKRRPSVPLSELDHRSRQPLQVVQLERAENVRAYVHPRFPRPHKRIRINWTDEENSLFFDTIKKNSNKDEQTVLREIVSALGGSRSWVQCKGHFRNLFAVGRITREKGKSKSWTVHEEVNGKEKDSKDEPTQTSTARNGETETKPIAPLPPNASTRTTSGNMSVSNESISGTHVQEETVKVDNRPTETPNGHVRRSASIGRLMNPASQDENDRPAPSAYKVQSKINDERRHPEYHVLRGKDARATENGHISSQTTRVAGRQNYDVCRVRETAIFMSKQAAAKEAYERSSCEPVKTSDQTKV